MALKILTDDEVREMIKNAPKLTEHEKLTKLGEANILLDRVIHNINYIFDSIEHKRKLKERKHK